MESKYAVSVHEQIRMFAQQAWMQKVQERGLYIYKAAIISNEAIRLEKHKKAYPKPEEQSQKSFQFPRSIA